MAGREGAGTDQDRHHCNGVDRRLNSSKEEALPLLAGGCRSPGPWNRGSRRNRGTACLCSCSGRISLLRRRGERHRKGDERPGSVHTAPQ